MYRTEMSHGHVVSDVLCVVRFIILTIQSNVSLKTDSVVLYVSIRGLV